MCVCLQKIFPRGEQCPRLFLLFVATQGCNVNSMLLGKALLYGGLVKLLTAAKLLVDASFLKLSLKLLQSSLNAVTVFYRNNNHTIFFGFLFLLFIVYCFALSFAGCKIT